MSLEKKAEKIIAKGAKGKGRAILKFAQSHETELRIAAATGLAENRFDESYNALVDLVRDPELSVRRAAVIALGINGRKAGAEHVRNIMAQPENASIVEECKEAIAKILASSER